MVDDTQVFNVEHVGERTILTFRRSNTWDFRFLSHCEDQLDGLLRERSIRILRFDLSDVPQVSSTLLGILLSLSKSGLQIELANPTAHVRDVLQTTQLNALLAVEPVDPANE